MLTTHQCKSLDSHWSLGYVPDDGVVLNILYGKQSSVTLKTLKYSIAVHLSGMDI